MIHITHHRVTEQEWPIIYEIETKMASDPIYYAFTDIDQFNTFMKSSTVFLLTCEGKPAGYCSYEMKNTDLAEINGMAVIEHFRRKGIGYYAMNVLLESLKNTKTVMLVTHPENAISLRMYLKFGFVIKEWKEQYINNQPRLVLYRNNPV